MVWEGIVYQGTAPGVKVFIYGPARYYKRVQRLRVIEARVASTEFQLLDVFETRRFFLYSFFFFFFEKYVQDKNKRVKINRKRGIKLFRTWLRLRGNWFWKSVTVRVQFNPTWLTRLTITHCFYLRRCL